MPLSIFIDALPFNEIKSNYLNYLENMQVAELLPNIAYSSSLHWQLYCNKYPDQRGVLVDWVMEDETKISVKILSALLAPIENFGMVGVLSKKVLDRLVYRKNTFANIPFKLRKYFSQKGKYLFFNKNTYSKEEIFKGYKVISQDEGHKSFLQTIGMMHEAVKTDKNIFVVFSFADELGHKCRRGELYSSRLRPYMDKLREVINEYKANFPDEDILIVSDHGMSTVNKKIDLELEKHFGKQSKKTYIAYCDTAVMCIWAENKEIESKIKEYLLEKEEGHLLTEEERTYFGANDKKFGDIIYIMREGNVFANNWFGKSMRKPNPDGSGMHGFWPERCAKDQMACMILSSKDKKLDEFYDYRTANKLITQVMKEG